MIPYKTVLIQGLGLIGGSIAHLVKSHYPDVQIIGVDTNPDALTFARDKDLISEGHLTISDVITHPDLAIFCTPLNTLNADIKAASQHFDDPMVLTDVGSVKSAIQIDSEVLRPNHIFVPGHPMAGTEASGIASSAKEIMEGATFLLIEPATKEGQVLAEWLAGLSFNPIWIAAEDHDRWVALASHIPYLMACLTVSPTLETATDVSDPLKDIVSSGFRDTTRVASMSPDWGASVCAQNKAAILKGIDSLKESLSQLEARIQSDDDDGLKTFFKSVQERRRELLG